MIDGGCALVVERGRLEGFVVIDGRTWYVFWDGFLPSDGDRGDLRTLFRYQEV
jgi:hypothetical protein